MGWFVPFSRKGNILVAPNIDISTIKKIFTSVLYLTRKSRVLGVLYLQVWVSVCRGTFMQWWGIVILSMNTIIKVFNLNTPGFWQNYQGINFISAILEKDNSSFSKECCFQQSRKLYWRVCHYWQSVFKFIYFGPFQI